jgi:hypothetical protein
VRWFIWLLMSSGSSVWVKAHGRVLAGFRAGELCLSWCGCTVVRSVSAHEQLLGSPGCLRTAEGCFVRGSLLLLVSSRALSLAAMILDLTFVRLEL